jgi:hypothetical protein
MRKRNWKEYNRQLVQRGSLTFFIDHKILNAKLKRSGKNGRPQEFSDPFIVMVMMVKIHFRLTYRSLEGFMKYLANLNKWNCSIPSYSLVCKRATSIKNALPPLSKCHCSTILVDASGAKVLGEGEWKVKIHGKQKRRKWVKVHIAIDAETQEIVAEATTKSSIKDGKVLKTLLNDLKDPLKAVIADGAYDERSAREEIRKRKAKALVPPPRNARLHGTDADRDDAILIIRGLGGDKVARSIWGKLTGYSIRALVETAFSRMKRLFGERLFSKLPEKQEVENRLRCVLLNRMRMRGSNSAAPALG